MSGKTFPHPRENSSSFISLPFQNSIASVPPLALIAGTCIAGLALYALIKAVIHAVAHIFTFVVHARAACIFTARENCKVVWWLLRTPRTQEKSFLKNVVPLLNDSIIGKEAAQLLSKFPADERVSVASDLLYSQKALRYHPQIFLQLFNVLKEIPARRL